MYLCVSKNKHGVLSIAEMVENLSGQLSPLTAKKFFEKFGEMTFYYCPGI